MSGSTDRDRPAGAHRAKAATGNVAHQPGALSILVPGTSPAINDGLDAAKIAAVVLMVANHVLLALAWPWPYWGYLIGRPCIPIFAFVIVKRLADGPVERNSRMLLRLAAWGVVAQPVYFALVGHFTWRLNILFTLAAGVALVLLVRNRMHVAAAVLAAAVLVLGHRWLDGGASTPIGIALAFIVLRGSPLAALAVVTLASAVDNAVTTPNVWLAHLTVLAGPALILLSPQCMRLSPRLPGWLFYGFYPAHLLGIWLVFGPYR